MQKRILVTFFMVILGGLFLYSCSNDTLVPAQINPATKISFATNIQPIFTQKCIGCHNGTTSPDLRTGNSFASLTSLGLINTGSPGQSILYTEMAPNGGMAGYTNTTDAQVVLLWIQQGAKNN